MDLEANPPVTGKRLVPWLVAIAVFMEALDTTILNTAVPAIARALEVPPLSMKSVLASYTLSLAIFIPISGWMADRFGTRRVFAAAIGLFSLGSFLCGISNNIHLLVTCRVLQGCGGAMMVPVGRLTVVRAFAKSELVRAMSFVAIPALIGPMLGPVVGGFMVSVMPWRMIFFVNLPIGVLGLYLAYRHLPDYRADRSDPLDIVGMVLFGSGIALLSYVLEVFGEHKLSVAEILGLLALSGILLAGYGRHAVNAAHPLLHMGLFGIRTFRVATIGSFFTRLGAGGMPFLLPLLYQVGLGYSAVESGLLIMPQALTAIIFKMSVPILLMKIGFRWVLVANTIFVGLTIMLFATVGQGAPIWQILLLAAVFGFCSSLQYTSMNTLIYADIAPPDASMASTIGSTTQQMSISFSVAGASLVTALFIPDRFNTDSHEMIEGLHRTFLVLGGLTLLSTMVFWELHGDDGEKVSQHAGKLPEY